MTNQKNQHVFPRDGGWMVRREGTKKTFKFFENKEDAMEYAGVLALNDGGSIITHKYNGQFKNFKHGNKIYVRKHKIGPIITGTAEIIHPIAGTSTSI